ncbi:aldose reductase [Scheffersomyces xylosifermentans]|uniref:aldose reductase n=1 Tax=Scheffersomyces xylosifermentans TaxID=1304137 RepID=UPI00315D309F
MTVELTPSFKTKSGDPITIGAGSGTAWKSFKRGDPSNEDNLNEIVDKLAFSIKAGYNHLDTAEVYTTHPEVGKAIKKSGAPREKLWITTKYITSSPHINKTAESPQEYVDETLKELGTDYIDLLLIHHPFFEPQQSKNGYDIKKLWKEFIDVKKTGAVRYIGVSNFTVDHLKSIIEVSEEQGGREFYPTANQIEFHPYLQNQSPGIVQFAQENGILIESFGPLTPLFRIIDEDTKKEVVDHPLKTVLPELAKKYNKTEAQILLRWVLEKKALPITTSSKEDRIKEALEIHKFELKPEDVELIDTEGAKFPYRAFFKGRF